MVKSPIVPDPRAFEVEASPRAMELRQQIASFTPAPITCLADGAGDGPYQP